MSAKTESFLEALRSELARQDKELEGFHQQMQSLPDDIQFAVREDQIPEAPAVSNSPCVPTAHIRA